MAMRIRHTRHQGPCFSKGSAARGEEIIEKNVKTSSGLAFVSIVRENFTISVKTLALARHWASAKPTRKAV